MSNIQIPDDVRATVAANLADFLLALEAKVAHDSDPISMEAFGEDGQVAGMVAFLRGPEVCAAFIRWATEQGYHTPGKGIVDGTTSDIEPVSAPELPPGYAVWPDADGALWAQLYGGPRIRCLDKQDAIEFAWSDFGERYPAWSEYFLVAGVRR